MEFREGMLGGNEGKGLQLCKRSGKNASQAQRATRGSRSEDLSGCKQSRVSGVFNEATRAAAEVYLVAVDHQ
jgi:hypothetical protein